jgi:hypothetical protein
MITKNYVHEHIISRLNSGNVRYHLVQNIFLSLFPNKTAKVNIYIYIYIYEYNLSVWASVSESMVTKQLWALRSRVTERIIGLLIAGSYGSSKVILNQECHKLCLWPDLIKVTKSGTVRSAEHVVCMREVTNACKVLFGECERKWRLSKTRYTYYSSINMELKGLKYGLG